MTIDLEKLDAKERQTFEAMLHKMGTTAAALSGKNPLSDPEYRRKCKVARTECETLAKAKGVTFEHVIAITAKIYVNPETKQVFTKGKPPEWLDKKKHLVTD